MAGPSKPSLSRIPTISFHSLNLADSPPPSESSSPTASPSRPPSTTGLSTDSPKKSWNKNMQPRTGILKNLASHNIDTTAQLSTTRKLHFETGLEAYQRPTVDKDGQPIKYDRAMIAQVAHKKTTRVALTTDEVNGKLAGSRIKELSTINLNDIEFDLTQGMPPELKSALALEAKRKGTEDEKNSLLNMKAGRTKIPDWANNDITLSGAAHQYSKVDSHSSAGPVSSGDFLQKNGMVVNANLISEDDTAQLKALKILLNAPPIPDDERAELDRLHELIHGEEPLSQGQASDQSMIDDILKGPLPNILKDM
jgi:hypothetical protein